MTRTFATAFALLTAFAAPALGIHLAIAAGGSGGW